MLWNIGCGFNEIAVEFRLVPFLEYFRVIPSRHCKDVFHEVMSLANKMHITIFNAVVHYLELMP